MGLRGTDSRKVLIVLLAFSLFAPVLWTQPSLPLAERRNNFEQLHREALHRRQNELGPEHPSTAIAMRDLGLLLLTYDRPAEALGFFRDALTHQQTAGKPNQLELARSAFGLAQTLQQLDLINESRIQSNAALAHLQAVTSQNPVFLSEVNLLRALLALEQNDYPVAASHYQAALKVQPDPAVLMDYADVLEAMGEFDKAANTLKQALSLLTETDVTPLSQKGEVLHRLALLETDNGNFEQARTLLEQARTFFNDSVGLANKAALDAMETYGNVLRALGELELAQTTLESVLQSRQKIQDTPHTDIAITLNNLAGVFHIANRLEQAEPLYRQAIEILEAQQGDHHYMLAESLFNLAYLLTSQGQRDEAKSMFQRTISLLESSGNSNDPLAGEARNALTPLDDQ